MIHKLFPITVKSGYYTFFLALLTLFSLTITSCSKDDTLQPETEEEQGDAVPFYQLQRVENFAVETDDENPTTAKTAVLFSLENNSEVPLSYAKTARWDVSFSGLYNSFLAGNNGSNSTNAGYGGAGTGGIIILEKPFEEVIDIPNENQFKTAGGLIGTDDAGSFGEGTGWYLYDFGGDVIGDGSSDKQHVAYALGNPLKMANGNMLAARTIVIRTANGNFAKIKMISCYEDAFTVDKWFRNTPHMFFTFEYVLAPAGSTKFEVKP